MSYKTIISDLEDKRYLFLKDFKIGPDDAKSVAKAIINSKITTLDLDNNDIGCEGLKCLAQVLKQTNIVTLKLGNNKIQDDGLRCLLEILKDTKVTNLDLRENRISCDVAQTCWETLTNTKIKCLELDVYFGDENSCDKYISQKFNFKSNKLESMNICLHSNDIGSEGADYLQKILQNIPVLSLTLDNSLGADQVQYLAQAFKNVKIMDFSISYHHIMSFNKVQYLVDAFKGSRIYKLNICMERLRATGAGYLAEFLKGVKIIDVSVDLNNIGKEGMKYIAAAIADCEIMYIDLGWNDIADDGLKYLADSLNKSKLLHIDLRSNKIGTEGAKYLANSLMHTRVTHINLDGNDVGLKGLEYFRKVIEDTNVCWINFNSDDLDRPPRFQMPQPSPKRISVANKLKRKIEKLMSFSSSNRKFEFLDKTGSGSSSPHRITRNTKSAAFKLSRTFEELVILNPSSDEFEFIIPNKEINSYSDYIFLIKTLNDDPHSKVHLFDLACKDSTDDFQFNFDMMDKIEMFIRTISSKFANFLDNNLPELMELLVDCNYVDLVKQFEAMEMHHVVENLLLHRLLYYVDDDQEILHPYIYKMLDKYNMPLYNEQMEPQKKQEIIGFFKSHRDIEDAEGIVDLLSSRSSQENI